MVNGNIARNPMRVRDLDYIQILNTDKPGSYFFTGIDIADFKVSIYNSCIRLIILTMEGTEHVFYNVQFDIVYKNKEHVELDPDSQGIKFDN